MIYAALFVWIYLSKLIYTKLTPFSEKTKRKLFIITAFAGLFFIAAFRSVDVGTDMASYLEKFTLIQKHTFLNVATNLYTERVEIGYSLLNKFVGLFTDWPYAIMIVNAFLFCFLWGTFVYNETEDDLTATVVFTCCGVFVGVLNATRQAIAIAFLMNAWGELRRKKYGTSLLLFLIAMSFHVTSAIFLLVFWFHIIREKRWLVKYTVIAGALLVIHYQRILEWVSQYINVYSYFENDKQKISAGGIWAVWAVELLIVLLFLLYYYYADRWKEKPVIGKLLNGIEPIPALEAACVPIFVLLYIVFTYMGTQFNFLDRFGSYFMPFTILLFLNFGKILKQKSAKLGWVYTAGLQACFIAYFLLFVTQMDHYHYTFFFMNP